MSAPALSLRHVFGLKSDVSSPLHWLDDAQLLYAAGHLIVVHNIVTRQQRFIPATDQNGPSGPTEICALAVSANRRYVAVGERSVSSAGGCFPLLSVFDLRSLKRRRLFSAPSMQQSAAAAAARPFTELRCLNFSADGRHLLALTGGPDALCMEWQWQKEQLTGCGRVPSRVLLPTVCSYCPLEPSRVCVSGDGGLTLLNIDWDTACVSEQPPPPLAPSEPAEPGEQGLASSDFLCHCWLPDGRCVLGSRQGQLVVTRDGRPESSARVQDVAAPAPAAGEYQDWSQKQAGFVPAKSVQSLCWHAGGLLVGCDGGVLQAYRLRRKDEQQHGLTAAAAASTSASGFPFELSCCLSIAHHPSLLLHLALSPAQSVLACVTDSQQALRLDLAEGRLSSPAPLLSSLLHSGGITGLSFSVRKPLLATCGVDRSVRLWNYLTLQCELCCFFPEPALCLSFHPSGLQLLIGFQDKLRLCSLLPSELRCTRELPIRQCQEAAFSHGGHQFAAVNGTLVQLYDAYTGEQLAVFRGHTAQVRSLHWAADDLRLVSAGVDGAVYQRRLGSAGRVQELVQKGCRFTSALLTDAGRMYAVGDDRMLKEIVDKQVSKTLDAGVVLTVIAAAEQQPHSRLVAGTDNGVIRSFALPLTGIVRDYQCHCRPVTRLLLSHDDRFLASAAMDGLLAIFSTAAPDQSGGDAALLSLPMPLPASSPSSSASSADSLPWSEDVLISRSSLEEAAALLLELRGRVEELSASNEYQLRLHELSYSEKVKEVSEKYLLQLEHDRGKVDMIADEKQEMKAECGERLRSLREQLSLRLQQDDLAHQQSMLRQIAEYAALHDDAEQQQAAFASRLQSMDARHAADMRSLQAESQRALDSASALLATAHSSCSRVQAEYAETRSQSAQDADAEMETLKAGFSSRLLVERDSLLRFKGELGIMRKKLTALLKDIEEQKERVKQGADREEAVSAAIAAVELRIALQRQQLRDKDRRIAEAERCISELKQDNAELEKFKFVLDFQIRQLKRQIEPRETEIADIRLQIAAVDSRLERDHSSNAAVSLSIAQLRAGNAQLQHSIAASRERTRRISREADALRSRVTEAVHAINGQDGLHALIHSLGSADADEPEQAKEEEEEPSSSCELVPAELSRQRQSLQRRVSELSSSSSWRWQQGRAANVAVMQDNIALIKEVQSMRKRHQQQQTQRTSSGGRSTRRTAEAAAVRRGHKPGGGSPAPPLHPSQEDRPVAALTEAESMKLLSMQRAQIVQLRERLSALTAQQQHERHSSSRSPLCV